MSSFSICARVFVLITWCLSANALARASEVPRRPNILVILADDLGMNDIGAWGDGAVQTPTLDTLSREAIRFRRHYTDSTCSVSRAALLTGRAPVSIGFEPDGVGLSPDLATLPKSLKQLGYRTHHIGKWHVGEAFEYPEVWPLRQGFDDWFGMFNHFVLRGPDANGQWVRQPPTYLDPWLQENDAPARQYQGHLDDLLTDRAVSVIEQASGSAPWFLNLWLLAPHHPYEPSETFRRQFPDTEQGHYLALLKQLDANVGRVLNGLKQSGQWDNTIVVFASDNGSPNLGRDSNWPLKGTKNTYREGGVRTPLLVRWPGHGGDKDVTVVTHITDLYPTLLRMVGGTPPTDLTGLDLTGVMNGRESLADRELYWAQDVKNWGMAYGGHLPRIGGFYRDLYATPEDVSVSSAWLKNERTLWRSRFTLPQVSQLIRGWEHSVRPVPLQWHPAVGGKPSYLTGRDYQRSPVFGSFSLGLGVEPEGKNAGKQTLIEQPGVWRLDIDEVHRAQVQFGSVHLRGPVLHWAAGCNSLVVSLNIRPASAHPYEAEAESVLTLYLNGESIFTSAEVLSRPTSASLLAQPTYIGRRIDGSAMFKGRLHKPVLVGKYLLPEQEGYRLADMDASTCPTTEVALR